MRSKLLTALVSVWLSIVAGSAMATGVQVAGTHVIIRTDNGGNHYTCSYVVTATFPDGSRQSSSGQTDLPTNGQNMNVADINFGKAVSSATLDRWSCQAQ